MFCCRAVDRLCDRAVTLTTSHQASSSLGAGVYPALRRLQASTPGRSTRVFGLRDAHRISVATLEARILNASTACTSRPTHTVRSLHARPPTGPLFSSSYICMFTCMFVQNAGTCAPVSPVTGRSRSHAVIIVIMESLVIDAPACVRSILLNLIPIRDLVGRSDKLDAARWWLAFRNMNRDTCRPVARQANRCQSPRRAARSPARVGVCWSVALAIREWSRRVDRVDWAWRLVQCLLPEFGGKEQGGNWARESRVASLPLCAWRETPTRERARPSSPPPSLPSPFKVSRPTCLSFWIPHQPSLLSTIAGPALQG